MPTYLTINEPMKCVMARISRQGTVHQQNFALSKYETWEKAERAGKRWVKAKLAELPPPDSTKGKLTHRNASGVVGVRLANATRSRNERTYPDWRWVAFWPGCPNSGGVGWSVKSYGDELAFASACMARKLESVDREEIAKAVKRAQGTKAFAKLVAQKKQKAPAL